MSRVGTVIRKTREEQRLSRTDLEALSGVSAETIYEVETGRVNPRVDTLYMIANGLGVPLHDLMKRGEDV